MPMTFEELLVLHCAPTLAGIKPASLFAVREGRDEARRKACELDKECERQGFCFRAVDVSEKTTLFFVYGREALSSALSLPENALFLAERGYSPFAPVESSVARLCLRLEGSSRDPSAFPHEIGIFLGYPLEDVEGFIANGGRACRMRGYWKVYGDEKRARALFRIYTECRRRCFAKATEGCSIPELCSAYKNNIGGNCNESSCYF